MNKNSDSIQTPSSSTKDLFSLPPGTFIGSLDDGSLKNLAAAKNCDVIQLVQPIFPSTTEVLEFFVKSIILIITGDGDYRLNSNFCNLLMSFKEAGVKIETLILNNLEIESETLKETFDLLKNELRSMQFNKVPLDQPHLKIINEIEMNLHSVSFEYVLPDHKNIFEEDENLFKEIYDLKLANLGQLRYLNLKGISITPKIEKEIGQLTNLQHLILENLVGNQALDFIKNLLTNLNRYSKLTTLSLAGNNLSSIDFSELLEDSDENQIFPSTLKKLNLNSTHLSDRHIQDILKLLQASNTKIEGLHLSKSHAYQRTFHALEEFIENAQNPDFQYEAPVTSLEPPKIQNNQNILEGGNEENEQPENTASELFRDLSENEREINSFIEESRAEINPQGLARICRFNNANQLLRIILKDAVAIKAFLNACRYNFVDFTRDPKSLIPKNDFNLALRNPNADLV